MSQRGIKMIELQNVTKKFFFNGKPLMVMEHFSLKINEGDFTVVLGPSGCGKTTILRLIGGFEFPDAGNVLVDGKTVEGPGKDRGMVFQSYTSFPWLTVEENVVFGLEEKKKERDWIEHLLKISGLRDYRNAYPFQLSGGQKQRVAVVRTFAVRPRILLMDEPFGALDIYTKEEMQKLILRIWNDYKTTIVFVTHDVEEALFLADRIVVVSQKPMKISLDIKVKLNRPRDRFSPDFLALKKKLIGFLNS
jgi:ABC-type nitrate/sulfonate/bicarbonate transport system ATPase subunit